jgi:hypothetical protein
MPFSGTEFDSEIELYFRLIGHESVLAASSMTRSGFWTLQNS